MVEDLLPLVLVYFAVVDPIGIVPIYLTITENFTVRQKQKIAIRGCLIAFIVLIIFGFFGDFILDRLNIAPESFMIAGGALLFLIAVEMVKGQRQARKIGAVGDLNETSDDIIRVSVSPFALPLLAGPGAITTVMLFGRFDEFEDALLNVFAVALVMIISGAIFCSASWASRLFNFTISTVMSRLVGILLAAIAIQTIIDGLHKLGVVKY